MDHIEILKSKLASSIDDKYPIGLVYGKVGLCIYFYYLSRWEDKEEYKQIADKLLNEVINNLSGDMNIFVENGLAGVAIGISHLVKEKFVEGEINEILDEIDSHIFKSLVFMNHEENAIPKPALIMLLYFLYLRYTEQTTSDGKYIFQELIIKTVELLQYKLPVSYFSEQFSFSAQNYRSPLFLYVVSKIYDLNIYNDRIDKILKDFLGTILSTFPVLHANRLYLLWGFLSIKHCLPDYKNEIDFRIQLLKDSIDIERIMYIELKNQDIYIDNGLSLVYILLFFIQEKYPEHKIDYDPQSFFYRIKKSEAWNTLVNNEFYYNKYIGSLDGFPGAILVLSHMKRYIL